MTSIDNEETAICHAGKPFNGGTYDRALFEEGASINGFSFIATIPDNSLVGLITRALPDFPKDEKGVSALQTWMGQKIRAGWKKTVSDTKDLFRRAEISEQPKLEISAPIPSSISKNQAIPDRRLLQSLSALPTFSDVWYKTSFPTSIVLDTSEKLDPQQVPALDRNYLPLRFLKRGDKILINKMPYFFLRYSTRPNSKMIGVETLHPITLQEDITFVNSEEQVFKMAVVSYSIYYIAGNEMRADTLKLRAFQPGFKKQLYFFNCPIKNSSSAIRQEFLGDMNGRRGMKKHYMVYAMVFEEWPTKAVVLGWGMSESCHIKKTSGMQFEVGDGEAAQDSLRTPKLRKFCGGLADGGVEKAAERELQVVTDEYDAGRCLQCHGMR